jgi:hypothetical protein
MAENVNLIGAIASVIALLIAVGTIVYKLIAKFRKEKVESEQQFQKLFSIFETASHTLGARTDLGFFLLNILGQFRMIILKYEILYCFCLLLAFIHLGFAVAIHPKVIIIFPAFAVIFGLLSVIILVLQSRCEKIIKHFNDNFFKIWTTPLQKHVDRQTRFNSEAKEG